MDGCHRPWLDNQMATFLRSLTLSTVTSERAHEEQTANKSHHNCHTLKGFSWTDGVKTPISTAVTAILDINAWPGTKWSFLNIAMVIEMTRRQVSWVKKSLDACIIPHNVWDIPALENHLASPRTKITAKRNQQLSYWYDRNSRKAQFCDHEKTKCKKLQDVQNLGFIVFKKFDARQEDTALY